MRDLNLSYPLNHSHSSNHVNGYQMDAGLQTSKNRVLVELDSYKKKQSNILKTAKVISLGDGKEL